MFTIERLERRRWVENSSPGEIYIHIYILGRVCIRGESNEDGFVLAKHRRYGFARIFGRVFLPWINIRLFFLFFFFLVRAYTSN